MSGKTHFLNGFKKFGIALVIILAAISQLRAGTASGIDREEVYIETDYRILKLNNLLKKYESPLINFSTHLIREADNNNLDWKLLPAITGVESSFGLYIPRNSFNAYGWNNGRAKFPDWTTSISVVSNSLAKNYVARGAVSVDQIAPIYNPVTPDAWRSHVKYFMQKLENTPPYIDEVLNLSVEI